jgi:uncharacterized protein (UPF0210 family)
MNRHVSSLVRTAVMVPACFAMGLAGWPLNLPAAEKPAIRAITGFIRFERSDYERQIAETLAVLRGAKAAFENAGYTVQTLRISTQPFPEYIRGLSRPEVLKFFREYDALVAREGFLSAIGPAMISDSDDAANAELLGEILAAAPHLDASLVVAGVDGVHWNAVGAAARLIKDLSTRTPRGQGAFQFAAIAMTPPHTPFYPGSYHRGAGGRFAVAWQPPNVIAEAFEAASGPEDARRRLERALKEHARAIDAVALEIERSSGWTYEGLDVSTAPRPDVSIGAAIEKLTGAKFGSSGTMTAATLIVTVLQALPVKRAGYSGLMIPVLEDEVLARRWSEGAYGLDALLAYSAVCGTGLDTVPLPGDVTVEQLERILGDMASLAVRLRKPLTARLLPAPGKRAGQRTEFDDPMLVNATLQPLP